MAKVFTRLFLPVLLGVLICCPQADAATLAGDQFLSGNNPAAGEYVPNKPFDTSPAGSDPQNPTVPGFAGPWNMGGTGLWRSVATGLDHPSIAGEAGGSARFQFGSEVGVRSVKRNLASPPTISTGDTFWMSGLVHLNENDPDFDGFAYAGFASNLDDDDTEGLKIGVAGDGSEMDLVFRHRISGSASETLSILDGISPGETHLVLVEAMVNSNLGGGAVPGNDNINLWIDPENVGSVAALGAPDVSVEDFALFSDDGLQFFTLEGSDITGDGVLFDEFFLGQALSDVVTAVPEPSSIALWTLLGLMGIGFGWRRSSRI